MHCRSVCFLLFFAVLYSCKDDDPPPPSMSYQNPMWTFAINRGGPNFSSPTVQSNLIHDGSVILGTINGGDKLSLTSVDIESGDVAWDWADLFSVDSEQILFNEHYVSSGSVYFIGGSRHYCIDLVNGNTVWKNLSSGSFSSNDIAGIAGSAYSLGGGIDTFQNYQAGFIHKVSMASGDRELFLVPPYEIDSTLSPAGSRIGRATSIETFVDNGQEYLSYVWQEFAPSQQFAREFHSFLALYNITTDEYVYQRAPLIDPQINGVALHPHQIADGFAYVAIAESIVCVDVMTGERQWVKKFTGEIWTGGLVVVDDVLVVACENKILYGLQASNGSQVWTTESGQLCSPLRERVINDVVYFSCSSDGLFRAVDVRTGRSIWKIDSVPYEEGSNGFRKIVYCEQPKNGKKGRVITQTTKTAYCFEAAR